MWGLGRAAAQSFLRQCSREQPGPAQGALTLSEDSGRPPPSPQGRCHCYCCQSRTYVGQTWKTCLCPKGSCKKGREEELAGPRRGFGGSGPLEARSRLRLFGSLQPTGRAGGSSAQLPKGVAPHHPPHLSHTLAPWVPQPLALGPRRSLPIVLAWTRSSCYRTSVSQQIKSSCQNASIQGPILSGPYLQPVDSAISSVLTD